MRVQGIFPPILTAFDEKGNVDRSRYEALLRFWAQYVDGMFVCGSYGSGPLMSTEERQHVFEIASETVTDKPLIVHVGASTTAASVGLAQHAEKHGAVAVASVPPYYYSYDARSIQAHFEAIITAVSIPVYAYDNPKTTGNSIEPAQLNELSKIGLHGLKDSSFDIGKLYMAMRKVESAEFDFVIGSESLMLPAFAMGVRGCIAGLGNPFPEVMQHFHKVVLEGDMEQASVWQKRVLILWDVLHIGPSVPTAYEILKLRGMDPGTPRRPLLPLDDQTLKQLAAAVEDTRELWDIA
jgi:N-acetylneuraminate lyase/4-hydroxy-tetrahydrodipicolinate synthase